MARSAHLVDVVAASCAGSSSHAEVADCMGPLRKASVAPGQLDAGGQEQCGEQACRKVVGGLGAQRRLENGMGGETGGAAGGAWSCGLVQYVGGRCGAASTRRVLACAGRVGAGTLVTGWRSGKGVTVRFDTN